MEGRTETRADREMSDALILSSIEWLEDCVQYGACSKCPRHSEGLCLNSKNTTIRALNIIYQLLDEVAELKGEKKIKTCQNANKSVTESSEKKVEKKVEKEVKPKAEPEVKEVKKRGRKPKNV